MAGERLDLRVTLISDWRIVVMHAPAADLSVAGHRNQYASRLPYTSCPDEEIAITGRPWQSSRAVQ